MYVIKDSFWNTCISTMRSGIYMSLNVPYFKKLTSDKIPSFRYIGTDRYKNIYWWSNENKKLARIDKTGNVHLQQLNHLDKVCSIIPYKGDSSILISRLAYNIYDTRKQSLHEFLDRNRNYRLLSFSQPDLNHSSDTTPVSTSRLMYGIAGVYVRDEFISITKSGSLFCLTNKEDSVIQTIFQLTKYLGMVYDSVLDRVILHDNMSVYINKGDQLSILKNVVNHLGIKRIKNMYIDQKYGNVFFQDENKLVVYNYYTNRRKSILDNYQLKNTKIQLHNNMLIVAGRFGILFSCINGPLQLSEPVIYNNTKSLIYNEVFDLLGRDSTAIINTDSGLLYAETPKAFPRNGTPSLYNLVVSYNDTMHVIHSDDTLFISQGQPDVLFDIVRPAGIGTQKIKIIEKHISGTWRYMNANEFKPSRYKPGHYYTILVQAEDDVWKSPPIKLVIYLKPHWWQTSTGKIVITLGSLAALVVFALLIFYYTRKNAVKSHTRKNYLLSLELKSIYAQINPHFIFNTLTTGLYFISENRNKDAYTHISSFSELLRSYLKSSRNRYVSLAEEIENIENYINLQQYRFEDKFEYSIEVDTNINTSEKRVPGLLLQPFVENAINHGLLHKNDKGHLAIKIISPDDKNVIICIEDDGIGRPASKRLYDARKNKPASYGNELIEDLIKLINADNQLRIDITYIDKPEPMTGTKVLITVKEVHHE